jgi:hypothetical protein
MEIYILYGETEVSVLLLTDLMFLFKMDTEESLSLIKEININSLIVVHVIIRNEEQVASYPYII